MVVFETKSKYTLLMLFGEKNRYTFCAKSALFVQKVPFLAKIQILSHPFHFRALFVASALGRGDKDFIIIVSPST